MTSLWEWEKELWAVVPLQHLTALEDHEGCFTSLFQNGLRCKTGEKNCLLPR